MKKLDIVDKLDNIPDDIGQKHRNAKGKVKMSKITELRQKDVCKGCKYFEPVHYKGDAKLHFHCSKILSTGRTYCAEEPLYFYVFVSEEICNSKYEDMKNCIRIKKYKKEILNGRKMLEKLRCKNVDQV